MRTALHSLGRASSLLAPPPACPAPPPPPGTGVTLRAKTCRLTAPFPATHPAPGKGVPAHISKIPSWLNQGSLGQTDPPPKAGELPGFPSWGAAPAQPPGVCSRVSSPVPPQQALAPSPATHAAPLPFPATDTQLGADVYIKSRVYCHFYLDLHNCIAASDVKMDVPSLLRELAGSPGARASPPQPSGLEHSPCRGSALRSARILPALPHSSAPVDAREGSICPLLRASRSAGPPATAARRSSLASNPPAVQTWARAAQSRAAHSLVGTAHACVYTLIRLQKMPKLIKQAFFSL